MASPIIGLRLSDEMLAKLDARRGDVKRSEYVRRLIEADLDDGPLAGIPGPKQEAKIDRTTKAYWSAAQKSKPAKASLSAIGKSDAPKKPPLRKPLSEDDKALLAHLAGVSSTDAKRACEALGWMPGRYVKAERALLSSGQALSRMGLLVKA